MEDQGLFLLKDILVCKLRGSVVRSLLLSEVGPEPFILSFIDARMYRI